MPISKKQNKLPYKRVRIIWQDILNDNSWFDNMKQVDNMTYAWCDDIGYLYSKDQKMVKIFTSYSWDDDELKSETSLCFQDVL